MRWVCAIGVFLASGTLGLLAGCAQGTDCGNPINAEICEKPPVTVELSSKSEVVRFGAGESGTLTITLNRTGEWPHQAAITVSAVDLVPGIQMEPVEVPGDAKEVTIELVAAPSVTPGIFPFKVQAQPVDGRIPAAELSLEAVVPGAPGSIHLDNEMDL